MSRTTGAPGTELGGVGVVMFRAMSACGENKLPFMKQRWLFFYYFFYNASSLKQWSTNITMDVPRKSLQLLDIFFHKIDRTDVLFPPLWFPICFSFRHDFFVIFYALSCIMTFVISIFLSLDFQKQLLALHAKTRIRTCWWKERFKRPDPEYRRETVLENMDDLNIWAGFKIPPILTKQTATSHLKS